MVRPNTRLTNKQFASKDPLFKACCKVASLPPTPRQAGKFLNKRGLAHRVLKQFGFAEMSRAMNYDEEQFEGMKLLFAPQDY